MYANIGPGMIEDDDTATTPRFGTTSAPRCDSQPSCPRFVDPLRSSIINKEPTQPARRRPVSSITSRTSYRASGRRGDLWVADHPRRRKYKERGKNKVSTTSPVGHRKKKTRFLRDMGPLASLHSTHGAVPRGRGPHNVSHLPTPSILCGCTIPAYLEVRRRKRRSLLQRNKGPVASREGYLSRFMCVHVHGGTPSHSSRLAQRLDGMSY